MMALNIVSLGKEKSLRERMQALGVREQDIEEQFVRSSGAGGQKVNKTSSCVVLHHRPTGVRVKCQQERSQALNRFLARRIHRAAGNCENSPPEEKALTAREAKAPRR